MAFAVKIMGFSESGNSSLRLEPPWWGVSEFRDDPLFAFSNDGSSEDYLVEFSVAEARALDERFRPDASLSVFASEDWQTLIRPTLDELDSVFSKKPAEFSHFLVHVYPWASWLD